jgi:hypothetical protein
VAKPLTEDEKDVRVSEELIRTGTFIPLDEVLKELGYERRTTRDEKPLAALPRGNRRRSRRS